ncbi:MAG: hypothetical protein IKT03_06445 [Muribaculaceae bacterium]|nr:hypothetical protein [Muribaculaceae bacterium]
MKKLVFMMMTVMVAVMFTSAGSNSGKSGILGTSAGDFTIGNDDGVINLKQLRGKYVLLSLWSSADVISRLENIKYDRLASKSADVVQLSVNFDRSRLLFDELVAADSLKASSQYFCEIQDRSVFEEKWGARQQYNTYLISPSGTVLAVNPSNDDLSRLVK